MKLADILRELRSRDSVEELTKKRFACANCGATWVELVGSVVGRKRGKEDLFLRIGMESEACQLCRMNSHSCQECGSKDVYELKFEKDISEAPTSFRDIKTISRRL